MHGCDLFPFVLEASASGEFYRYGVLENNYHAGPSLARKEMAVGKRETVSRTGTLFQEPLLPSRTAM